MAAKALQFTILTAARSNETIGAPWSEFDLDAKVWTIPKERMREGQAGACRPAVGAGAGAAARIAA